MVQQEEEKYGESWFYGIWDMFRYVKLTYPSVIDCICGKNMGKIGSPTIL